MGIRPENYFWLKDGRAIKNLYELSNALVNMPADVFAHHVNSTKNDFSSWIRDVVKNKELADEISKMKSAKEINIAVKKRLTAPKRWIRPEQRAKVESIVRAKGVAKKMQKTSQKDIPNLDMLQFRKQKPKDKIIAKIKEFVFVDEPKKDFADAQPKQTKIRFGASCPYKSYECGILEFLAGIVIGLIIGLFLSAII